MTALSQALARALLLGLYTGALLVVELGRKIRRPRPLPNDGRLRVLMTGTFYNRGWLRAHARPIASVPAMLGYLMHLTVRFAVSLPALVSARASWHGHVRQGGGESGCRLAAVGHAAASASAMKAGCASAGASSSAMPSICM